MFRVENYAYSEFFGGEPEFGSDTTSSIARYNKQKLYKNVS
jgi:hypothetical protein